MWTFEGDPITDPPADMAGFVYEITNTVTGRRYLGKKVFWSAVVRPPLKGKTRRRRSLKESDWQTYYGSNDVLNEDVRTLGHAAFSRVILRMCRTKSEMSYYEAKYQFDADAILCPTYYNGWISVKITRSHMKTK